MRENAGKMRTRITPNTDTFYAVFVWEIIRYANSPLIGDWYDEWSDWNYFNTPGIKTLEYV